MACYVADVQTGRPRTHRNVITRNHFTRIADEHDVDAKTVERDYVLTHAVAAIGQHSAESGLVFKGGTALRLCYFEDYRYSADLDFSLGDGGDLNAALGCIRSAFAQARDEIGLPHLAVSHDGKMIEYEGPLGKRRDLKLDVAVDERIEDTATQALLPRYPDQVDAQISVYTLSEIAAEKLRCVIQRLQARDPQWRSNWESEMREHLPGEPDHFDAVERAVRRALRSHLGDG